MTDSPHTVVRFNPMKGISLRTDWYCPKCLVTNTTYVTVTETPTHPCRVRGNTTQPLQERVNK